MKKRPRHYILLFAILFMSSLLPACGKKEYVAELGIDGYVYVPEKVSGSGISNFKIAGDYLYYAQDGGNTVRRIPLADAFPEEGLPIFSKGETVLTVSSGKVVMPEDVTEALEETAKPFCTSSGSEGKTESGEIKFWWSLKNYVIDESQRCYYVLEANFDTGASIESAGRVLCSQNGDGHQGYKVYWPEIEDLAAGGDGNVYVLASGEVCTVDSEGRRQSAVSVEGCQIGGQVLRRELFGDPDGRVYYTIGSNLERKTFEIMEEGGVLKLQEAGGFLGNGFDSHFAMPDGNILLYAAETEQLLYEYDRESGRARELLCWTDSGFQSGMVGAVAGLSSDKLLVSSYGYGSRSGGLYLLIRTPVEELPEKELLVLASVLPNMGLQDAVMEFNQNSSRYRITIDSYGAYYSDKDKEWIIPYLDPALVSANPPDLVDLSRLNIPKYARKNALTDLYPYLENSSVLSKEDFLENMLEGLTFDGKLACLSSRFSVRVLTGAAENLRNLEGWTMEDLYALAEAHPQREALIVNGLYGKECGRDFYLGSLCPHYYLEEFVDWDSGGCSFDSEGFGRMLEWVEQHTSEPADTAGLVMMTEEERLAQGKAALLISDTDLNVYSLQRLEFLYGEEYSLRGYPSAGGGGYFGTSLIDAVGIVASSKNKEGAWEFLEYYMTKEPGTGYYVPGFSANRTLLQESFEDALREYKGTRRDVKGYEKVGGELVGFYAIPQRQADALLEAIKKADFTPLTDEEETIIRIVTEEAESYYRGDRSMEEVTALIQNRAELVLKERGGR